MEINHLNSLLICKQQVLFHFIHLHFHVLDAPALEKVIREMPKKWDYNGDNNDLEDLLRDL